MKAVINFGVRGGNQSSDHIVSSARLAGALANDLAYVFGRENARPTDFVVSARKPRVSWTSSTHYVSVTALLRKA